MLNREKETYAVFKQATIRNYAFLRIQHGLRSFIESVNEGYAFSKSELMEQLPEPLQGTPTYAKIEESFDAYWLIGKEIVDVEQKGETRAGYGKHVIKDLSRKLTDKYGKGFSIANLKNFRQFFLVYQDRSPGIGYTKCSQFFQLPQDSLGKEEPPEEKSYTVGSQFNYCVGKIHMVWVKFTSHFV